MEKEALLTNYERIIDHAKAVPELLNLSGDVADSRIIRALEVAHRTWYVWKDNDFENITRANIDKLLKLLNCRYEDIFS
jgi:hypothetical protein